jgi:hypothetical protein
VVGLARFSDWVARIAVPFFGGFLGAIGVALAGYLLGIAGVSALFGVTPWTITQQSLQNISWGGAMWGLVPAAFLILKKGNIYLISLFTMIVAVTYGMFVLFKLPLALSLGTVYTFLVNLTYAVILALTIKAAGFGK